MLFAAGCVSCSELLPHTPHSDITEATPDALRSDVFVFPAPVLRQHDIHHAPGHPKGQPEMTSKTDKGISDHVGLTSCLSNAGIESNHDT